jgi:hypothetical protein
MKNLYDLLGARPDDDAEGLRNAFRKAAKANHPDHHSGDGGAPIRFREVVQAYDILRDAEQRARYDELLEFERFQRRLKLRRAISCFVYNAIATAGLASVLAGGYTLFTYISRAPVPELVETTTRRAVEIAAVQPAARTDPTKPHELRSKPAGMSGPDMPMAVLNISVLPANDGGAREVTGGGTASSEAGGKPEVAKIDNAVAPIDQAHGKIAADHPERDLEIQPVDSDKAPSDVRVSSQEEADGVPKASLSDVAIADDGYDKRAPDKPGIVTHDMKTPELKLPGKPRMETKREAKNHPPFRQALLENRSTSACTGRPCSTDIPLLFGVGF